LRSFCIFAKILIMERIRRNDYIAQISSLLGKGEAVVLTGHRRAGKSCILEFLLKL
jgi:predicted AAA+ superfamily ATPase